MPPSRLTINRLYCGNSNAGNVAIAFPLTLAGLQRIVQTRNATQLLGIYEFYQEYYKKVEAEMRRKDKFTETCPQCELPSVDLMTGVCEVCGHVGDLEN